MQRTEPPGPSLALVAWFDGWGQASHGAPPATYPRALTADELTEWREDWAEGQSERLHHERHGFGTCTCEAQR